MNTSPELVWGIVSKNSSFLVKRKNGQPTFTREANNLTGLNTFKYSGLANANAVGMELTEGKFVTMVTKSKKANKPNKLFNSTQLNSTRGPKVINALVEGQVDKTYYRRDLTKAALARYTRLHKSIVNKNNNVTYKVKSRRAAK